MGHLFVLWILFDYFYLRLLDLNDTCPIWRYDIYHKKYPNYLLFYAFEIWFDIELDLRCVCFIHFRTIWFHKSVLWAARYISVSFDDLPKTLCWAIFLINLPITFLLLHGRFFWFLYNQWRERLNDQILLTFRVRIIKSGKWIFL